MREKEYVKKIQRVSNGDPADGIGLEEEPAIVAELPVWILARTNGGCLQMRGIRLC